MSAANSCTASDALNLGDAAESYDQRCDNPELPFYLIGSLGYVT